MSAAVVPRPLGTPDATRLLPDTGTVVLAGVRWETYEALLHDLAERRFRHSYDRGSLEIMAPLFRHETYAEVLGVLVKALCAASKVRLKSAGSTTLRRQTLERGLEPDRCFYIRSLPAVLGKLDINLGRDPPPDLAIEIDNTSSCLDRLGVYAALGVPEIWRYDGERLEVLVRRDASGYDAVTASPTFPALPVTQVLALLDDVVALDDETQERRIRAWVRKHVTIRGSRRGTRGKKKS